MRSHYFAGALLSLALLPNCFADVRSVHQRLHLGPVLTGGDPYVYFPFEVPAGTEEIVVQIDYDRKNFQNTIDFGIFDARFSGRNNDLNGYRGKNPNRVPLISVVGRTHASNGHIAGPMPPGTWRVMFYIYQTLPEGVDVDFMITLTYAGTSKTQLEAGPRWVRGDLHAHTLHSDGTWTVSTLAAAAQTAGLDFIAVTDHNTVAHHEDIDAMPAGVPLLIRGMELTSAGGHANIWGLPSGAVIEHRQIPPDPAAMLPAVKQAHDLGALIAINHPFAICKACSWAFGTEATGFDGIEIWNGTWGPEDESALQMWDRLLRLGRKIAGIGASDTHGPSGPVGQPTTHVRVDRLDTKGVLQGIQAGRAYITGSPGWSVDFSMQCGTRTVGPGEECSTRPPENARITIGIDMPQACEAVLISSEGEVRRWRLDSGAHKLEAAVPGKAAYYRLELRDEKGEALALTNPIWLQRP